MLDSGISLRDKSLKPELRIALAQIMAPTVLSGYFKKFKVCFTSQMATGCKIKEELSSVGLTYVENGQMVGGGGGAPV